MKKGAIKMRKKFTSALLTACLVLGLALPARAASQPQQEEAIQVVNALGIMVGDTNGNMNLSSRVTRAEFITMAVKATPGGEQIGQAATSPYPDVPRSHWASGYVEAGVAAGLVSGYTDGTFRPNREISLAEGVTIALQLLGYGPSDFSGAYPTGQLAMYHSLKLDQGVTAAGPSTLLTRQDAMYLFYNLMTANTKEGRPYLESLGYSLNAAGEIDLVALISGQMEGPVVAQGNWQSSLSFDPAQAKVYRNGGVSTLSAIQNYDVVYWNRAMRTLWGYSDKVTGTIQALEPSASNPTSVTVSGRTCTIETSSAAYSLSTLGEYALGDTVTLLLGREGGVAAVIGALSADESQQGGVVTSVSNSSYPDGKGGTYQAKTVTLLSTDGQTYRYQTTSSVKEGALVRAAVDDQGKVTLKGLTSASLTGKVNAAGTKLGSHPFAEGAEILDVSDGQGARIYPSRLAGLELTDSMVKYHSLNGSGEIETLVLNDVTGDAYRYGILTRMESTSAGEFSSYYSYELDVGGQQISLPQSTTRYPVERGPIRIKGDPAHPDGLYSLTLAGKGEASGGQFLSGSKGYTLSDNLMVYEYQDGAYYLSTLARVQGGRFELSGWYDKSESLGGRIRVIVARSI